MVKKELTTFKNFGNVLRLTDERSEAFITLDFGPRVIKYYLIGGENIMNDTVYENYVPVKGPQFDEYYYKGAFWNIYGGHRLWYSPESMPESYYPDNDKVDYTLTENGAIFTPRPQTENGVAYEIEIYFSEEKLVLKHHIKNIGSKSKRFAAWALTVAALGGVEIIPFNNNDTGLLHNRQISIWPYTDLRDDRIYFGHKYATLLQKNRENPIKLGFNLNCGHIYYVVGGTTFKKEYTVNENGIYPDNNVSFETYTCKDFTEIESLSELCDVAPGESIIHTEKWSLYKTPAQLDPKNDEKIEEFISLLEKN